MKLKKSLGILLAGVMSLSLVACSGTETDDVESGSATLAEEQQKEETQEENAQEEIVLVDDELAKIVVTEKKIDAFGAGYSITVENKSDQKIIVQTRDTSVDGTMEDPLFSPEIMPGKKANDMMQFMNVTELENLFNVEGKLIIMDENYTDLQSYDMTIE